MKSQVSFVCQECGYESPQWLGKCPECGEWNSFKEIQNSKFKIQNLRSDSSASLNVTPQTLSQIKYEEKQRIRTGFSELDTVLGGGIVRGSVILLAGDPGIGKSTLLLQLSLFLSSKNQTVLYISGEESEEQIKLRAQRIGSSPQKNKGFFLLSLSDADMIVRVISEQKPSLVVIDSIQTVESENAGGLSGSVGQVRYATSLFIKTAKSLGIPTILVGHVTKEGMVAGPMMLSHMVDTVLFFEGEKTTNTRILRSLKNRFGPVDEVGVFGMDELGIKELKELQNLFVTEKGSVPGSVLTVTLEGSRPFLVEIQSLVVFSKFPMPRRVTQGVDVRRLELLIAVLQKHCGISLGSSDVFVNVAGGLRLSDPASDLAICLSLFSSFKNIQLSRTVAISEVGLLGELRPVSSVEKRIKEAKKLGFTKIVSPKTHKNLGDVLKAYDILNTSGQKQWQEEGRHLKLRSK